LSGGARSDSSTDRRRHHPPTGDGGRHSGKFQLRVLYTHQKTKKKTVWKDGMLSISGTCCSLYDAHPVPSAFGNGLLTRWN
jgi:hypothetical protein